MKGLNFLRFVDRLSWLNLGAGFVLIISASSGLYYALSTLVPSHGLVEIQDDGCVSLLDAIYCSIVTASSLGYGDIHPIGISRIVAATEVLGGLVVVGLAVTKLASERPSHIKHIHDRVSACWVDRVALKDDRCVYGITRLEMNSENLSLKYWGYNYNRPGQQIGYFDAILISENWPCLKFHYENSQGSKEFEAGVVELTFDGSDPMRPVRYSGEIIDYERQEPDIVEGWRIPDDVAQNLDDPKQRTQLICELIQEYWPDPEHLSV